MGKLAAGVETCLTFQGKAAGVVIHQTPSASVRHPSSNSRPRGEMLSVIECLRTTSALGIKAIATWKRK